jgi:hypothetical protein
MLSLIIHLAAALIIYKVFDYNAFIIFTISAIFFSLYIFKFIKKK